MSNAFAIPSYRRIAETLRARIVEGAYSVGERIPAAIELEKAFHVSDITIRKALELLAREGWVTRRRGIGTVVMRGAGPEVLDIRISGDFSEWMETASGKSLDIDQHVLDTGMVPCPAKLRPILELGEGEQVWRMRRVRSMQGEPISYHVNYGRRELADLIAARDLEGGGTFIKLLRQRYSDRLARVDQQVKAAVANMDSAELLGVDFGAPIFDVENIYRTGSGRAAAVTRLLLRADRYCYSASLALGTDSHSRGG